MTEHRNNPAVAILPAAAHWTVLIKVEAQDEPVDYLAEPVIAWHIDVEGLPTPITLRGVHYDDPVMRPDESVRAGEIDFPDFAEFIRAMRATQREDDDEPDA